MDADIQEIYNRLRSEYSLKLTSSFEKNYNTEINYPILCGSSVLGTFELFYGDLDFEFYSMRNDGKFFSHSHLQSAKEAEQTVVDFMNGRLAPSKRITAK